MTCPAGFLRAILVAAAFVVAAATAVADTPSAGLQPVPALTRPVTDLTGTLAAADVDRLEAKIRAFRAQHGAQFSVLVVQTTQPETAFDYSMRVVEQWKLGDVKRDDGLLLLVAMQDHATQVQVGYGLEGAIPDAVASRVLRDVLAPRFRDGDFAGGIGAALDTLMAAAAGDATAQGAEGNGFSPPPPGSADSRLAICVVSGVVLGFVFSLVAGRVFGALAGGGVSLLLALMFSLGIGAAIFLAILVFALIVLRGGGFGGLGGGGFGGGGGWSGGGGGFGGGGASGRW